MLVKSADTFQAAIARKNLKTGERVSFVTEIEGHHGFASDGRFKQLKYSLPLVVSLFLEFHTREHIF
jgi:hypothetical protein